MRKLEALAHIVLLLAVLLACKGNSKSSGAASGGDPSGATTAAAEATMSATVANILADYKANEVRGDAKYKGHLVLLAGAVNEIKKDFTDSTYVELGNGGQFEFETVHCMMRSDQVAAAAGLNKGQMVAMRGRVSGLVVGSVVVDDCEIIPTNKPGTAPPAGQQPAQVQPAQQRPAQPQPPTRPAAPPPKRR
jgi:hypothetical protein